MGAEQELEEQARLLREKEGETRISVAPEGRFAFQAGPRVWRDRAFAYLFAAAVVIVYAVGLYAIHNAEADLDAVVRVARYNPSSNQCEPIKHAAWVGTIPTHVALVPEHGGGANVGAIVATTAALVVAVGFGALWLLHRHTRAVILTVFGVLLAIPATVAVALSTLCLTSECSLYSLSLSAQISVLLLVAVSAAALVQFVIVCRHRSRLDLTVQILRTALQALKQNLALLAVTPVLSVAANVVAAPVLLFGYSAFYNGRVAPNLEAIRDPSFRCELASGAPCCEFQQAPWVKPYLIFAYVAVMWVLVVGNQLQILVVSGTISQWYFAPSGSSTVGTTKRSIRNAFGPSFGTACLSSLMLTISALVRSLLNKVGATNFQGIASVFLRACFAWLFQLFEFFTRFTTNFAAISGDSFCASARATCDLLKRNLLSTLIVEAMVQYVIFGIVLIISLASSFTVFGAMHYMTATDPWYSLVTANVCFLISLVGLAQIYGALSTVVDTVYICYAMDKDVGAVSKQDVHDLYMLLPPTLSGDGTMLAVRQSEP